MTVEKNKSSRALLCGAILLAVMLIVTGIWQPAQCAYADSKVAAPEQYISADDLNRPDTVYNMAGNETSQIRQVSFGTMNWYIAGYDKDSESPVLFSTASTHTGIYDVIDYKPDGETYSYAGSLLEEGMTNMYNDCLHDDEKAFVKAIQLGSYPTSGDGYAYFYPADFSGHDLLLGMKDGVVVKENVWANRYSEKFWLRARKNNNAAYYAYPGSEAWYSRISTSAIVKHAYDNPEKLARYVYLPACHLNPSALLFASAATTSAENAQMDENNIMKLRFDSAKNGDGSSVKDRLTSSAEVYDGGIAVGNPTAGEFLYVQWNDGTGDHVKSFDLKSGKTFFTTSDGIPAQTTRCRVWLEEAGGKITYAKEASYPSDKVFASYKNVKDGKSYYVGATPVTEETRELSDGWYVARGNVTVNHSIQVSGNAHLILEDDCELYVHGQSKQAAIRIDDSSQVKLTIYEQEGATGFLSAEGGRLAAGIGGSYQENTAHITINGGSIRATGGEHGAGIGGGFGGRSEEYVQAYAGNAHHITINGGTVVAKGGTGAAGIGGGIVGEGSAITVNGGQITASGGNGAAGIGGGARANGSNISIHKGEMYAHGGGTQGAGIGGGYKGNGSNITIDGGKVSAEGGDLASGIGGGYLGTASQIFFGSDIMLRADKNYPVTTEIEHKNGEDCAQKLSTKRCVKTAKDEYGSGEDEGTTFMATGSAKAASNVIKWSSVEDADGYDIYYARCGKTMKKVKSTTALKYTKKKLNRKKNYKYCVRAYVNADDGKECIAKSPVIYIAGSKARYSNATKIKAEYRAMSMEVGDTDVIGAGITGKSSSRPVLWKNHTKSKLRYISSDKSVVTVNSKGQIRAEDEGAAHIYVYAASGAFAKISITVK